MGVHERYASQLFGRASPRCGQKIITGPNNKHSLQPCNTPSSFAAMSSLLDTVLNSDAAPTPSSDAGNLAQSRIRSSSRPRAPPSESAAAHSDHEGFADDEVVGARVPGGRRPLGPRADIPKVVDVTGETLSLRFQEFLEGCVWRLDNCIATRADGAIATPRIRPLRRFLSRAAFLSRISTTSRRYGA